MPEQRPPRTSEDTEPEPGGGAFLVEPHDTLYPCLFDGDRMRPEARERLLGYMLPVMESAYPGARDWTRFTIFGSGVSYNWDETGDLDVQVWVDTEAYAAGGGPDAGGLIKGLRTAMGPVNFPTLADIGVAISGCSGAMLVQYYAKAGKGTRTDNLAQRPYACYDLDADEWLVVPEPITPEFYGDQFILVEPKAKQIADEADDLLDVLERGVAESSYWDGLADKEEDPRYREQANEARLAAEQAKAGVAALFDAVFRARGQAYSTKGKGLHDERDAVQKMLEMWGIFQKLKHAARAPLPWENEPSP